MCMVVVEGGAHSIEKFAKLMNNRIDWTENSMPGNVEEGNREALAAWMDWKDEKGALKDLRLNRCVEIWKGEQKNRQFRKWSSKVCELDGEAREALSRGKMESFWGVAKACQSSD